MLSRLSSHSDDASISSPIASLTVFIQRPGRGKRSASDGLAAISSHRRAEKRRRARRRQQRGERALPEMAAQPVPVMGGQRRVQIGREAQVEQAEQVGAEQQRHQHHKADKPRILELNAPAERVIAEAQQRHQQGQRHKRGDDTQRRCQELQPYAAPIAPLHLQDGAELDTQYRQDARHQVEDQPARQRHQYRLP